MFRLAGSYRAVSLDEAERRARATARAIGVTRVTDVTRLDRPGVPTWVAIRPTAAPGAICVTAGKGWTPAEACVGALMEAVEHAWAEPDRHRSIMENLRVRDLLDGDRRPTAILDLCPQSGSLIDPSAALLAVRATEVRSGETALVPAELVFHPAPRFLGTSLFGTGTNGLASGSTLAEATLHGLIEVIERDVLSFHNVRDESVRVASVGLPPPIAALQERLAAMRIALHLRYLPNAHGLPCFTAIAVDLDQPKLSIRGDGLHLDPAIALARAVTEAMQCRLTIIHGGRDDLDHFVVQHTDEEHAAARSEQLQARLLAGPERTWDELSATATEANAGATIEEILTASCERLASRGFPQVLRVVLTPDETPVCVVRVIVPGLECRLAETRRVGPRLREYMRGGRGPA